MARVRKAKKKKRPFWKRYWLEGLLVFAAANLLYLSTAGFEFVLDDQIVITDNSYIQAGVGGIKSILTEESMAGYFGQQMDLVVGARYRPLSLVTFALENELWGINAGASHLVNGLLYGLLALIIFRVLSIIFKRKKDIPWFLQIAFAATVLYVVHPLHTEAVANVKGRDEILAMLFSMLTLFYALRYTYRKTYRNLIFMGISFFLALLSKENAITFLAVVPLTYYFFRKPDSKIWLRSLGTLAGVALLYILIRLQVIGYLLSPGNVVRDLMNDPFVEMNTIERLSTIVYTWLLYLKLLVFPHPLTHDYYPYHIPIKDLADIWVWVSLLLHVTLLYFFARGWRTKNPLAFTIAFYFATFSIVSNLFFNVGTFMNERFLFMPSLSICMALAWLSIHQIPRWLQGRPRWGGIFTYVILGIFVVGFTVRSLLRIPVWRNPLTLNEAAIQVSTNSSRANTFYGTALFNVYRESNDENEKRELVERIRPYIDRALQIYPQYGDALTMKAGIAAEEYRYDRDLRKLLNQFYEVLQQKPGIPFIHEYCDYLNGAVGANPVLLNFYYNAGYQLMYQQKGNVTEARRFLNYGTSIAPGDQRFQNALQSIR